MDQYYLAPLGWGLNQPNAPNLPEQPYTLDPSYTPYPPYTPYPFQNARTAPPPLEPVSDERMAQLIKERHIKDDLQDAWLDMFLVDLHKAKPALFEDHYSPGYGTQSRVDDVLKEAEQNSLFETLQEFLNQHNAGIADKDIMQRLEDRFKLFRGHQKYESQKEGPMMTIKSGNALLDKKLRQTESSPNLRNPSTDAAEHDALRVLADSISEGRKSSLFAVGGKLSSTSQTIRLWWKTTESEGRISMPVDSTESNMHELVQACVPATFGRGQEDVLDERYRKAGKLAVEEFLTDFCPYKTGIANHVAKLLGCGPEHGTSIRCELYNLNVYSGPKGRFGSHVDTPRGEEHFASLVVCLPFDFEGGDLEVRHNGQMTCFQWDKGTADIQWAAFYSDCEHEVKEVRSGNRFTLTYNLYWTREEAAESSRVDPSTLAVTKYLRDLLRNPNFFPQGIVLGAPCSHYYAHNTQANAGQLPSQLKGSDRMLGLALDHLGIENQLSVVIGKVGRKARGYGGISIDDYYKQDRNEALGDHYLREFQGRGYRIDPGETDRYPRDLRLHYFGEDDNEDYSDIPTHSCGFNTSPFKSTTVDERVAELQARGVIGLRPSYKAGSDVVVAHSHLGATKLLEYVEEPSTGTHFDAAIDQHYPHTRLPQVLWLYEPENEKVEGVQMAYMAYGNESTLEWTYSRLAHLFIIPPIEERKDLLSDP